MKKVASLFALAAVMLMAVSTLALAENKTEKKAEVKPGMNAEAKKVEKKLPFKDEVDNVSYAIGYQFGKDFKQNDIKVNPEVFIRGLQDAGKDTPGLMTIEEVRETLMTFQRSMMEKQQKKMKELGEKNLTEGKTFLAANAKKEGVKTLPSGLQYKVIKEGTGALPKPTDKVKIHYTGKLTNGTEFDSSVKRNQPLEVPVTGGMIQGMSEALKMMKVGSKWELVIPANLAYGDRPGRVIPPNSVLIFDVELLEIAKEAPKPAPQVKPITPVTPEKK